MYINNVFGKPGWIDKGMNRKCFLPFHRCFQTASDKGHQPFHPLVVVPKRLSLPHNACVQGTALLNDDPKVQKWRDASNLDMPKRNLTCFLKWKSESSLLNKESKKNVCCSMMETNFIHEIVKKEKEIQASFERTHQATPSKSCYIW